MDELTLPGYLTQLYDYNYWANQRILAVAEGLADEQLFHQHGHSWGNVHGVLLHMMNAEWIWSRRWQGVSPKAFLTSEQFPSIASLRSRWSEIESEIRAFITTQTPQSLQRPITYTNTQGQSYTLVLWQLMAHLANHGTHHRGELAAMYALMGVTHPEEDWLFYLLSQSGQRQA